MATTTIMTPFGGGSGYDPLMSLNEIAINNLIGNYFSGLVGSYFGGKSTKKSIKKQQQMMTWQALNMPKYQKQGLIDAGYNPLLAVMNGANTGQMPSAYNTFQAMANLGSNSTGSASVTPYEGEKKSQEAKASKAVTKTAEQQAIGSEIDNSIKAVQLRQARAEASVAEDEASARQVQAHVSEAEALATLDALGVSVDRAVKASPDSVGWNNKTSRGVYTDKNYDRLVEKIRNAVDWDVKSKSDAHFWWRRGIEAIHGINEAGSAYDSYRGSRKIIHKK